MSPFGPRISFAALLTGLALLPALASAQQQSDSQYFQSTPLPEPRDKAGAVVMGNYLYVIGGHTQHGEIAIPALSTLMAPIDDQGNVGAWQQTTPLPEPLLYIGNSTLSRGPIVYVCGGNVNDGQRNIAANFVAMSAQRPDGHLSRWLSSERFPGPGLQAATAVATRTHLYIIGGGDTENNPQPIVYFTTFRRDGLLDSWQRGPELPRGLWFHMAGIANDRIYVWGGTNPSGPGGSVSTTYVADIAPNGSISAWRETSPLPANIYFSASASLDDTLFNFSGQHNGTFVPDVLFAIPEADGSISWDRVRAAVPLNKYLAPAVDEQRGIIYLPGGRDETADTAISEVFGYRVPRFEVADAFAVTGQEPAQPGEPVTPPPTATPGQTDTVTPTPTVQPSQLEWNNYQLAELEAVRNGRNMLLYFQTPQARLCRQVEESVFQSPAFASVGNRYALANINAADNRALAVTYGVYRVPSVVVVTPQGRPVQTIVRDITIEALQRLP
jgi:hypothetical protein